MNATLFLEKNKKWHNLGNGLVSTIKSPEDIWEIYFRSSKKGQLIMTYKKLFNYSWKLSHGVVFGANFSDTQDEN